MSPARAVVVLGGGGHGREIALIVRAMGAHDAIHLLGVVDDRLTAEARSRLDRLGVRFLGHTDVLRAVVAGFVAAFGDPAVRRRYVDLAAAAGLSADILVDPSARVAPDVTLGPGAVVFPMSSVSCNVEIGAHSHVNVNVSISHDCVIEDFVTVSPGVVLTGGCRVGRAATIGSGAVLLPEVSVGAGAYVGAGAVVRHDVPPCLRVAGVPARPLAGAGETDEGQANT